MAQVIRYVDPDVAIPGDGTTWDKAYASLFAWNAAEATDLDAANNYMTVHCRSSSGTNDTTPCNITGWTTSATDYIEIIGDDFPATGIYDATKYVLHNNDTASGTLYILEDFVRVHNLQILVTASSTADRSGFYVVNLGATPDIRIDSCIVKGVCSGTGSVR